MKKLGLYIHIPFCRKKCEYCKFYSIKSNDDYLVEYYTKLIIKQITKYSEMTKYYYLDTIYFGGGSPSYINYKYINSILEQIYKTFKISSDIEITLECNPEDLNASLFNDLKSSCINRISLGIQSLLDDELKILNRNYDIKTIYNIMNLLTKININNISADLIYSLPNQTLKKIMFSLNKLLSWNINHLSIYNFEINNKKFKSMKYPSEILQFKMYDKICNLLNEKKFIKYEIANFSKNKFECKHNKKYWNLNEYIGIGSGAHSFFDNKRFFYDDDINNFDKKIIYDNYKIEKFEEYIMLKLRTNNGIDLNFLREHLNFKIDLKKINFFIEKKYLYIKNNNYILTNLGSFFIDKIIYELI